MPTDVEQARAEARAEAARNEAALRRLAQDLRAGER